MVTNAGNVHLNSIPYFEGSKFIIVILKLKEKILSELATFMCAV